MSWEVRQGHVLTRLREMPAESVHCCVTSPPYYNLRDYETGEWVGGDPGCDHRRTNPRQDHSHGAWLLIHDHSVIIVGGERNRREERDGMGTEATQGAGSARCDICGDRITAGESVVDDGHERAHRACVAQWFRSNFGREELR